MMTSLRVAAVGVAAILVLAGCQATVVSGGGPRPAPVSSGSDRDLLGEARVSDRAEEDIISVRSGRTYRGIQVCARRRAIEFGDLDVRYGNGQTEDIRIRRVVRAGECTRVIDLSGDRRRIDAVRFVYRANRAQGEQPIVQLYGIGGRRAAAAPAPRPAPRGAVFLGERQVADNVERDRIRVARDDRYRAIQICVQRRAVDFGDLKVVFGNNREQTVELRRVIRGGQCSRRIDLNGNDRVIKRVEFRYRSARAQGPQPIVGLFGYR